MTWVVLEPNLGSKFSLERRSISAKVGSRGKGMFGCSTKATEEEYLGARRSSSPPKTDSSKLSGKPGAEAMSESSMSITERFFLFNLGGEGNSRSNEVAKGV